MMRKSTANKAEDPEMSRRGPLQLRNANQSSLLFSRATVFLHLTFDTYQQIGFQPPNSWSAHIK